MVQSMWSEEKKIGSIWQWPEPEPEPTAVVSGGKRPVKFDEVEEELPVQKRWKSTTDESSLDNNESLVSPSQYNPLDEPSPLGLRLKKSPSLLELIQMRLSEGKKNDGALPCENLQGRNKKDVKATKVGSSGPIDKLKASNFPGVLLRIGKWELNERNGMDLLNHSAEWLIASSLSRSGLLNELNGMLKMVILVIQTADSAAQYVSQHEGDLVAKCYFAKHKLVWEVLDCGLKNKIEIQWEDIVALKANCPDNGPGSLTVVLGKPPLFFRETNPQPRKHTLWQATSDFTDGEASTFRQHYLQCAPDVLNKHFEKLIQCDTRLNFLSQQQDTVMDFPFSAGTYVKDPNVLRNNVSNGPEMSRGPSVLGITGMVSPQLSFLNGNERGHGCFTQDIPSTNSVSTRALEDYRFAGNFGPPVPKTKSISDLVNHIGHRISEPNSTQVVPFLETISDGCNKKHTLDNIPHILLDGTRLTTASDDKNSPNEAAKNDLDYGNDDSTPGRNEGVGMTRKDSYTDLLHGLPKIESLPTFLFDISEDGEILNP